MLNLAHSHDYFYFVLISFVFDVLYFEWYWINVSDGKKRFFGGDLCLTETNKKKQNKTIYRSSITKFQYRTSLHSRMNPHFVASHLVSVSIFATAGRTEGGEVTRVRKENAWSHSYLDVFIWRADRVCVQTYVGFHYETHADLCARESARA